MQRYRTVNTRNGYTLQKLNKVLFFKFWCNVCCGTAETVNSYINTITGKAIVYWLNSMESVNSRTNKLKFIFKKCLKNTWQSLIYLL